VRLVRVQAEHGAPAQALGEHTAAVFDHADTDVAVFERTGKVAFLEWRAHAGVFALRHFAAKHQRLGATADRAEEVAHAHLALSGWARYGRSQLTVAGADCPESERGVGHRVIRFGRAVGCSGRCRPEILARTLCCGG